LKRAGLFQYVIVRHSLGFRVGGKGVIGTLTNSRTDEAFEIVDSPTAIGRHEANVVRLRGFAISRFHAEIGAAAPGKPYLEDMGSTYGTYVNGHKIEGRVSLHDGDEILMGVSSGFPNGEYSFVFRKAKGSPKTTGRAQRKTPTRHDIREGLVKLGSSDAAHVFHLDGLFRRKECDSLATEVLRMVREKPKDVVVELSGVEYMNSYGMGMIVRLSQDVEAEKHKLVLAGAQGLVLKLFRTVGLDRRLACFATEEEALGELSQGRTTPR
jgi:anti-anti-sigma factor